MRKSDPGAGAVTSRTRVIFPDDRVKRNAPGFPFLLTFGDSARFSRSLLRRARIAARGARRGGARFPPRARREKGFASETGRGRERRRLHPAPLPGGISYFFGRRKRARVSGFSTNLGGPWCPRGTRARGGRGRPGWPASRGRPSRAAWRPARTPRRRCTRTSWGVARFGGARALGVTRCVSAAPTWCQSRCGGRGLARSEPFLTDPSPDKLKIAEHASRAPRKRTRETPRRDSRATRPPSPVPARGSRHTPRPTSIPRDDPLFLPTSRARSPRAPRRARRARFARPPSDPPSIMSRYRRPPLGGPPPPRDRSWGGDAAHPRARSRGGDGGPPGPRAAPPRSRRARRTSPSSPARSRTRGPPARDRASGDDLIPDPPPDPPRQPRAVNPAPRASPRDGARWRVFAVGDIHADVSANMAWVRALPAYPRVALVVAGDVATRVETLEACLRELRSSRRSSSSRGTTSSGRRRTQTRSPKRGSRATAWGSTRSSSEGARPWACASRRRCSEARNLRVFPRRGRRRILVTKKVSKIRRTRRARTLEDIRTPWS